jgi:hypothetical protein
MNSVARAANDTARLRELRARYRAVWDAYQVVADGNAALLRDSKQPSNEQLIKERKAVEAVERARAELLAGISYLGY